MILRYDSNFQNYFSYQNLSVRWFNSTGWYQLKNVYCCILLVPRFKGLKGLYYIWNIFVKNQNIWVELLVTGNPTSTNSICFYQEQGALNYAEVNFNCPRPGLVGKVVTVQNLGGYNLEVLEIEPLGKS